MRAPILGQCPCESNSMSLRFEIPCERVEFGVCSCANPRKKSLIVPGKRELLYDSVIHVFGQAEVKNYTLGQNFFGNPDWMRWDAIPDDSTGLNSYWLGITVNNLRSKIYLNNNFGQPRPHGNNYLSVDYHGKIRLSGQTCVTLNADVLDSLQSYNQFDDPDCGLEPLICENRPTAEPIAHGGVFIGQWLQVDFGEFFLP